jgi:YesN/AraC family two-component response regulator
MTALRVIAIDDEPLALRRLQWCLEEMPGIALVGQTGDPQHGLEMIRTLSPDVVLLDVEMPELTGFELIESLGSLSDVALPEIVFVTAFDHFAVKAFGISAVDYLLKPVERGRLHEALERARVRRELRDAQARVQELREIIESLRADRRGNGTQKKYENELWIREGDARVRALRSRRRLCTTPRRPARAAATRASRRSRRPPRSGAVRAHPPLRDRAPRFDRCDSPPRFRPHVRGARRWPRSSRQSSLRFTYRRNITIP